MHTFDHILLRACGNWHIAGSGAGNQNCVHHLDVVLNGLDSPQNVFGAVRDMKLSLLRILVVHSIKCLPNFIRNLSLRQKAIQCLLDDFLFGNRFLHNRRLIGRHIDPRVHPSEVALHRSFQFLKLNMCFHIYSPFLFYAETFFFCISCRRFELR